jgi:putative SOS response-associated peptidase YedK
VTLDDIYFGAVILEPREYAEWLAESERPPVHLLRIMPDEDMTVTEMDVTTKAEKTKPTNPNEPPMQPGFLFG